MVLVSLFAPVMGCGCDTVQKKEVEPKPVCPEGYHLECEKVCTCYCKPVYPVYPRYMDTYTDNVKKLCCCMMVCKCVPDVTDDKSDDAPTPTNNFAPTGQKSDVPLYTYYKDGERITSTETPLNPDGPVIVTPGGFNTDRTPGDYTGSIKQQRIDQWRENHAE